MSFHTLKAAAKQLGVVPNTIGVWIRQNKLPHEKLGKRIIFDDATLEKLKEVQQKYIDKKKANGAMLGKANLLAHTEAKLAKIQREHKYEVRSRSDAEQNQRLNGHADHLVRQGRVSEVIALRDYMHDAMANMGKMLTTLLDIQSKQGVALSTIMDELGVKDKPQS